MEMEHFFKGKKIFITGHTGFKGSWLCRILVGMGANVTGYSLEPPTTPNLFSLSKLDGRICSIIGDIRDYDLLHKSIVDASPEIIIHLAAQPLVRYSYEHPLLTYETNVLGTANLCECIRSCSIVKSFLNVTTDKVYNNKEWVWGYRENEALDGYDPYSNSKSCSELVTHSFKRSFFNEMGIRCSTARAGNVIGGGDFSADRIIPDCVRAVINNKKVMIRNPNSVRPYQHVLEPLFAYLLIVMKQYENSDLSDYYNIGPDESDSITTGKLAEIFCKYWGNGATWYTEKNVGPHEANYLKLDCSLIKRKLLWEPKWSVEEAVRKTVEWTKIWSLDPNKVPEVMDKQIEEYIKA